MAGTTEPKEMHIWIRGVKVKGNRNLTKVLESKGLNPISILERGISKRTIKASSSRDIVYDLSEGGFYSTQIIIDLENY